MGHWWLGAKTYLQDRPPPKWTNKGDCVHERSAARYDEKYAGLDRTFAGLTARPVFVLDQRERRPLSVRSVAPPFSSDRLDPFFLASREFSELVRGLDDTALLTVECDVLHHGRNSESQYVMADAAICLDGLEVFDRPNSQITIQVGFAHDDGRKTSNIDVNGVVTFAEDVVADSPLFRVRLGWMGSRIAISDALAEAIFARGLLGLCLKDATGGRTAPARFREYSTEGWEELYPA
jgi:hypothetical protein